LPRAAAPPLFPYTTLFRSRVGREHGGVQPLTTALRVEYCGEWYSVEPTESFTIGRTADLSVDDNPYLHRHFLELRCESGVWLLRSEEHTSELQSRENLVCR